MEESVVVEPPPLQDTFERDLLDRIQQVASGLVAIVRSGPFNRAVARIDWEQVAFDHHSAEECRERWTEIECHLRVHRTLDELLGDARASRWDWSRARKATEAKIRSAEGAPVRPLSSYLLFCQKWRPKLAKKHPGMSQSEFNTLLKSRYASLPSEKKDAYKEKAATAMAEYKTAMAEFRRRHPELEDHHDKPPERPSAALWMYTRKHCRGRSRAEGIAAFHALSAEDKARYKRKAKRAQERYKLEVARYKEKYPGWQEPGARKEPKRRLRRAYDVFLLKEMPLHSDLPKKERMRHCADLWHSMDDEGKQLYRRLAEEENNKFDEHLATLTEEEKAELFTKKKKRTRRKTPESEKAPRKPRERKHPKLTAKQLFLQEKMPHDFEALSEAEWRRILSRKFAKLSDQDKGEYVRRAAVANRESLAAQSAAETDAEDHLVEYPATPGAAETDAEDHLDEYPATPGDPYTDTEMAEERAEVNGYDGADGEMDGGVETKTEPGVDPLRISGAEDSGDEAQAASSASPHEEGVLSPVIGGKKRSKASSDTTDDTEEAPKKKKKKKRQAVPEQQNGWLEHQAVPEQHNGGLDPNCVFEWFVENFNVQSADGLSERKIRKKAKKAWNSLSDEGRRKAERQFIKATRRR